MQIAIVGRDLDATLRKYVEDYGIGPWQMFEFHPGDTTKDLCEYGQPVERSSPITRFAVTTVGQVMWEVIEPLDEESVFARFLAEKGERRPPHRRRHGSLRRGGGRTGRTGKHTCAQRHRQRRHVRVSSHRSTVDTPDGPVEFWHQTAAVELPLVSYDTLTRNVRIGELTTARDILAFRDEQDPRVSLESVGFRPIPVWFDWPVMYR